MLGVGNPLAGDDAVGIEVVKRLKKLELPEEVDLIEGGTLSFQLINFFDNYDKIVVVDAVKTGRKPGSVVRLEMNEFFDFSKISVLTSHDFDFFTVAKVLSMIREIPEIVVIGVEVENLSGFEMSDSVRKSINEAVKKILEEINHSLSK
ncbi:hydrogenase maturation protease [Ferroglobus placidus]|uniref:hydrogenase maturation protease n=1 Tax=Ferroglobus placidus TaxID=54261 RepID=UPI000694C751|nr:hydrogenase maturation protease [Ferroglobus placidus]